MSHCMQAENKKKKDELPLTCKLCQKNVSTKFWTFLLR